MSGHSKWSNIKFRKERQDAKKSKIFSSLGRDLTIAARLGGSDPDMNPRLRIALQAAKAANMPKDNIERAIKKGTGELGGKLEELTLEGYGPTGVAVLTEVLTDNRNRAVSEIRSTFNKHGLKMAEAGGVKWMFEQKGKIILATNQEKSTDDLELTIIDSGADDYQKINNQFIIYTKPNELDKVRIKLEENHINLESLELIFEPTNPQPISEEDKEKLTNFI
ncbi:MAG: YebC/PmpR family DNA-binding transcriptional regulator, partial [Patescibacteria group bacterium]|nr:YebC/PmpR family DNA-binding transcriptional regulator [Patescibacteria group bacterium]